MYRQIIKCAAVALLMAVFALFASTVNSAYAQSPGGVEVLEALVIEGKLQKPEVFYILSRHKTKYNALKLKRSFLKEIRHSLKKNPF